MTSRSIFQGFARGLVLLAAAAEASGPSAQAGVLADSVQDFSGIQGYRGWTYLYRDVGADGGADNYDPQGPSLRRFQGRQGWGRWDGGRQQFAVAPWLREGAWDLSVDAVTGSLFMTEPWTHVGRTLMHPNGDNSGAVHWAIRRWTATVPEAKPVLLQWTAGLEPGLPAAGNGFTVALHIEGVRRDSVRIEPNQAGTVERRLFAVVAPGSRVDVVVKPEGNEGTEDDRQDHAVATLVVDSRIEDSAQTEVLKQPDGSTFDPWTGLGKAWRAQVPATANLFAAGRANPEAPAGGGAGTLPVFHTLEAGGQVIVVTSVAGETSYDGGTHRGGGDGVERVDDLRIQGHRGISGQYINRVGYLAGVFLGPKGPPGAAPPPSNFGMNPFQGFPGRASMCAPLLGQSFFIGDGWTGTGGGNRQKIVVPRGATQLWLGFLDAPVSGGLPGGYGDNQGTLDVEFRVIPVSEVDGDDSPDGATEWLPDAPGPGFQNRMARLDGQWDTRDWIVVRGLPAGRRFELALDSSELPSAAVTWMSGPEAWQDLTTHEVRRDGRTLPAGGVDTRLTVGGIVPSSGELRFGVTSAAGGLDAELGSFPDSRADGVYLLSLRFPSQYDVARSGGYRILDDDEIDIGGFCPWDGRPQPAGPGEVRWGGAAPTLTGRVELDGIAVFESGVTVAGGAEILAKGSGNLLGRDAAGILAKGGGAILAKGGGTPVQQAQYERLLAVGIPGLPPRIQQRLVALIDGTLASLLSEDSSGLRPADVRRWIEGSGLLSEDSSGLLRGRMTLISEDLSGLTRSQLRLISDDLSGFLGWQGASLVSDKGGLMASPGHVKALVAPADLPRGTDLAGRGALLVPAGLRKGALAAPGGAARRAGVALGGDAARAIGFDGLTAASAGDPPGNASGSFELHGDLIVGERFSPGAWAGVGTVEGNVYLLPGAGLDLDVGAVTAGLPGEPGPGSRSDRLVVRRSPDDPASGQVLLGGELRIRCMPGYHRHPPPEIVGIQAEGGLYSGFSNVESGGVLLADDGVTAFRVEVSGSVLRLVPIAGPLRWQGAPAVESGGQTLPTAWMEWTGGASEALYEVLWSADLKNWQPVISTYEREALIPVPGPMGFFQLRIP